MKRCMVLEGLILLDDEGDGGLRSADGVLIRDADFVLGDVAQDVGNVFKAVDDVGILQHDLQSSSSS